MGFGIILKRKREECNFSQAEVAKRMGISQKTISAWETERNTPKLNDYAKMAEIYNCSIQELSGQRTDISTITTQDILLKLPYLQVQELEEIQKHVEKALDAKYKVLLLERREEEMQKRILEYQREIRRLKGGSNES